MDGCMDGRMDGRTENLRILQDFVPYWGRCPATAQLQPKKCIKRGKGTADHMMPLGDWFGYRLRLLWEVASHSFKTSVMHENETFACNFRTNRARKACNLSNCEKLNYNVDALNDFFGYQSTNVVD